MDLDAEFNKLRRLSERAEPVIAEFEARQGDGRGTPAGFAPEQWAELSRVFDRLDLIDARLAPWEQGEKDIPPGVQDLALRIVERVDRIEASLANVEAKIAEFGNLGAELARITRLTADLAEIVENRMPAGKPDEGPQDGSTAPEALGSHGHG